MVIQQSWPGLWSYDNEWGFGLSRSATFLGGANGCPATRGCAIGLRNKVEGEAEVRKRKQRELQQAIKEKQTELAHSGTGAPSSRIPSSFSSWLSCPACSSVKFP